MQGRGFFAGGLVAFALAMALSVGGRSHAQDNKSLSHQDLVGRTVNIDLNPNVKGIKRESATVLGADGAGLTLKVTDIYFSDEKFKANNGLELEEFLPWSMVCVVLPTNK